MVRPFLKEKRFSHYIINYLKNKGVILILEPGSNSTWETAKVFLETTQ